MDYLCAKFGDFICSLLVFIVESCGQTHTQNRRETDDRCTHATIVHGPCTRASGFHYPS